LFNQRSGKFPKGLKTFEVWRLSVKPGNELPANVLQGEEVLLTMSGTGRLIVAGKSLDIRPDTTVVIPLGAERQVANTGKEEMVLLVIRGVVPT
jgi:mannose-6-phosphate isomerase-like protein (cupin superfamily)